MKKVVIGGIISQTAHAITKSFVFQNDKIKSDHKKSGK